MEEILEKKGLLIIKSQYIIKELFTFLEEKVKLNVIIYNKLLQNISEVDIDNYKKMSGKYKIGEKNGKAKVFKLKTDIMIFEGDYINGKKNGKGKEYSDYNGKLIFEGEYINDKRNGKGKEYYYYNGKLMFEGKY